MSFPCFASLSLFLSLKLKILQLLKDSSNYYISTVSMKINHVSFFNCIIIKKWQPSASSVSSKHPLPHQCPATLLLQHLCCGWCIIWGSSWIESPLGYKDAVLSETLDRQHAPVTVEMGPSCLDSLPHLQELRKWPSIIFQLQGCQRASVSVAVLCIASASQRGKRCDSHSIVSVLACISLPGEW